MTEELASLLEMFELKDERRTGWVLRQIDEPESVADHSWGTAILCLLYANRVGLDHQEVLSMALIHDLAEARTGDIATRAERGQQEITDAEKETAERKAIADLLTPFEDGELHSLWAEYESRNSPAAQFVKDMDLIDNCLQALKYEREGRYDESEANEHFTEFENLDEFFATAGPRLQTTLGEELFDQIRAEYEQEIGRSCEL